MINMRFYIFRAFWIRVEGRILWMGRRTFSFSQCVVRVRLLIPIENYSDTQPGCKNCFGELSIVNLRAMARTLRTWNCCKHCICPSLFEAAAEKSVLLRFLNL